MLVGYACVGFCGEVIVAQKGACASAGLQDASPFPAICHSTVRFVSSSCCQCDSVYSLSDATVCQAGVSDMMRR